MKKQVRTNEKTILTEIAAKLIKAQQEIDELTIQVALGKADAMDKFEDIKAGFKKRLSNLKESFTEISQQQKLGEKIKALENLLNTGKAENKSAFESQKEKIMKALASVEKEIKKKFSEMPAVIEFIHDVETFKLKVEILRLRFVLKKFEIKEGFKSKMNEAKAAIKKISSSVGEKVKAGKARSADFRVEVDLAYQHMKKALQSL